MTTSEYPAGEMVKDRSRETSTSTEPSPGDRGRILLAEDDKEMRALLTVALHQHGYEVDEVADGIELLQRLVPIACESSSANFDLLISDIRLPSLSGLDVFEGISRKQALPPTILITAFGDEEIHERARRLGTPLFDKPFDIPILLDKVHELLST